MTAYFMAILYYLFQHLIFLPQI